METASLVLCGVSISVSVKPLTPPETETVAHGQRGAMVSILEEVVVRWWKRWWKRWW
jgi:hypothetical protein